MKKQTKQLCAVVLSASLVLTSALNYIYANSLFNTPVSVTSESLVMDVTVPTSFPIHVNNVGEVTVADGGTITNNSYGAVAVTDITVIPEIGYEIGEFGTDYKKRPVDLREFTMSILDKPVSTSGHLEDATLLDLLHGNGGELFITYDADSSAHSYEITDEVIANVEFQVDWYNGNNALGGSDLPDSPEDGPEIGPEDGDDDNEEIPDNGPVDLYFNDITSQIKNVYDAKNVVKYDFDHQGDLISLYHEGEEVEFERGISMAGADVCFTFTDLKMYGYERFTAYLGTHYIARFVESTATSFTFEIRLDGETAYKSDQFHAYSEYEYVDIDLTGYEVMQIIVNTGGSGTGDYAAMGDPMMHRSSPAPYMDVFDLEFNSPHQVTESNLLAYADAWDIDLSNLSDGIWYETNYIAGQLGTYDITYFVEGSTGCIAERTVKLIVTGDDYTEAWTVEDYKTPYVNYMYHPRNTLVPQQRALFDLALDSVLKFDPNGGHNYTVGEYTKWGETVYELKLDLQAAGIFLRASEFNTAYYNTITDADPRAYIFKQWTTAGRYTTDPETGMLKTYHVFISKSWASEYEAMIPLIIKNTETFLAYSKDDMTDAQKLYFVTTPYKNWISYNDGGFLVHALGRGYAKCGGNSMGVVHIAQRLGITSFYCQVYTSGGELHAATYQKLVDEDGWYMCDKLWAKQWTAPLLSGFSLSKRSGYGWIEYAETSMPAYQYSTYPSIWMSLTDTTIILEEGDSYDLEANIVSISSVLNEELTSDIVTITTTTEDGTVIPNNTESLTPGIYHVYYDIDYSGVINVQRRYEATIVVYTGETQFTSSMVIGSSNVNAYGTRSLWNTITASEEAFSGSCTINNGGFITIDNTPGFNVISFKYGASSGVRTSDYAIANCRVAAYVYFDGVLQANSITLSAYTHYATMQLYIPDGVQEVKILSKAVSSASGHGTIGDIKFYTAR